MAQTGRVDLKQYYLQQMGIQTWIPRAPISNDKALASLARGMAACQHCCWNMPEVFVSGNPQASLLIIVESLESRGRRLLERMLYSVGLYEQDVYITTALPPPPVGCEHCDGYLTRQIELVAPRAILILGAPVPELQGNIPCINSYSPMSLLKDPGHKKSAYLDLLKLKQVGSFDLMALL